jgi:hypothetical protein
VQEPYEGCRVRFGGCGEAGTGETLRCRLRRFRLSFVKHVRGVRVGPGQGFCWIALEGRKPKGASGEWRANPVLVHKGLSQGLKPRNRSPSGRSDALVAAEETPGETVCGFVGGGNASAPCARGKLRRAKSHERRQCETKLAGVRRA